MRAFLVILCLVPMVAMARVAPRVEGSVKLTTESNTADMEVTVLYQTFVSKFGYDNDELLSSKEITTHVENDGTFTIPSYDLGKNFRRKHLVWVYVTQTVPGGKSIFKELKQFEDKAIESMGSGLKNIELKETIIYDWELPKK